MVVGEAFRHFCHIERNLRCLKDMPRVGINNIRDFKGGFKQAKVKGRGPGSKTGKTSGHGHKGQGQRGTLPRIGFEGGQTPFYRLVPKWNTAAKNISEYHVIRNERVMASVSLDRLQYMIDSRRLDPSQKLDIHTLWKSGATQGKLRDGVKLISTGSTWFQGKLDIEVSEASAQAIEAVERNGGKIQTVYHDRVALRNELKPEKFVETPRPARPYNKLLLWYADADNRGYLACPKKVAELREKNIMLGPVVEKPKVNEQIGGDK